MITITITAIRLRTIRELRLERGLTQKEVAVGAQVSLGSVNRIEKATGPYGINYKVADMLAKFFGVPMNEIAWPFSITDIGRPGGTGTPCKKAPAANDATCPVHFITLPNTGVCSDCE